MLGRIHSVNYNCLNSHYFNETYCIFIEAGVEEKQVKWFIIFKVSIRHISNSSQLQKNSLVDKISFSQMAYSWTNVLGSQLRAVILQGTKPGTTINLLAPLSKFFQGIFLETDVDARRTTNNLHLQVEQKNRSRWSSS